jgi:biotin transport system substrate-specific component
MPDRPPGTATPSGNFPRVKTRDLSYVALFAAIVAVLGLLPPVPVPGIPVPITAQTLGVMLAGSVLGARRGGLALLVFLAVVAVGAPVLSGGRGGLGVFVGPTAGFLYSWPVAAFVVGLLTQLFWRRFNLAWALIANLVGGVVVIYAIGIPFTSLYGDVPLSAAFTGSMAFVPGDLVKAGLAAGVAVAVRRAYPVIERPVRRAAAG